MMRIGDVELKLASGPVPHYKEIVALTRAIIQVLEHEFGPREVIRRFSDPLWFNAYACLVGFEWNYSGMTTVTLRALKEALKDVDTGLIALGGKGKNAKITEELRHIDLKDSLKEKLAEVSIKSARLDSTLIQDGYSLYFHFMIANEHGDFTVINQKMSTEAQKVRRFHWISDKDLFSDPQIGFGSASKVLNIAASEIEETRKTIMDILHDERPEKIVTYITRLRSRSTTLVSIIEDKDPFGRLRVLQELPEYLRIPKKVHIEAIRVAQEAEKFEDLLVKSGFGPGLARSLVYVAHIIYGSPISWKDPVRYTFAHGTKAGRPYYVRRRLMRREAEVLENAIKEAKLGNNAKLRALKRLKELVVLEE
ncbi:MAG: DUF763 domain-containing protein [Euryarchaeota archaeon]|nr:DUF763 domain-containing protein [Euryarchaeota archaeon]